MKILKNKDEPQVEAIIKNLLMPGAVMRIEGEANTLKDRLALQLALTVASGNEFLGFATQAVPVMFCTFDKPLGGLMGDLLFFRKAMELPANLPVRLGDYRWNEFYAETLIKEATEFGARLIVFDRLPHSDDDRQMCQTLEDIAAKTGAAIVYCYTLNKTAAFKPYDTDSVITLKKCLNGILLNFCTRNSKVPVSRIAEGVPDLWRLV